MDKSVTKTVLRGLNIPTLDYLRVNECDYKKRGAFLLKHIGSRLKYPVVLKPAHLGSSIGIALARDEGEVKRAIENAFRLDDRVIIEKYLDGKKDINCAVYSSDGEIFVSEPEEAFSGEIYTFEEKYLKKEGFEKRGQNALKAGVTGETREKIRSYAKTVYKRMNLRGVVRMDFLVSGQKVYLCEVNTVPGSLAYYLFCERVTDARAFFSTLIEDALRPKKQKEIVRTGILQKPMGNYK
jgi:D-alanine-D-alanine ligase